MADIFLCVWSEDEFETCTGSFIVDDLVYCAVWEEEKVEWYMTLYTLDSKLGAPFLFTLPWALKKNFRECDRHLHTFQQQRLVNFYSDCLYSFLFFLSLDKINSSFIIIGKLN